MKINKKSKEGIKKKIALISLVALFFNATMLGVFVPSASLLQADDDDLCAVDVDVVLIMDRSGSMGEGEASSKCEWWVVEEQPGGGYGWSFKIDYDVTQDWCDDKSAPPGRLSTFFPATNSKIVDAKDAANTFLGYLGTNDQSALVSFADTATLDKQLSDDHGATQIAIDNLTAGGDTNIGDAIAKGMTELGSEERANPRAVKVMILLTDGKANKPDVSNPESYAIQKAQAVAALGYKIFTIGLGSDSEINELMLQQIANDTGAVYYHAPTSAQLEDIYSQISQRICEFGSISGCKYSDTFKDIVGGDFSGKDTIIEWEIILTGGANGLITQLTDKSGCYTFAGLEAGTYTVSEGIKIGVDNFEQTYPESSSYIDIVLNEGDNLVNYDFGNYFPVCGNGILDENYYSYNEECDDGNLVNNDGCSASCITEASVYQCSDGIDNDLDGLIDEFDPGCWDISGDPNSYNPTDDNEYNGVNPGDVIINEIMQNPAVVSDTAGEWFELYNPTVDPVYLDGCIVRDDGVNSFTITSLTVPANGGYVVLSNNDDPISNGGVSVDYKYSGFILGNGADEVIVECGGEIIDEVKYDNGTTFPDPTGASMILENFKPNHIGGNWCESSSPFGSGDLGTPGDLNDSCGGIICQASETSRECVSDGFAEVTYEWNDPICGNSYTETEKDETCVEEQVYQCSDGINNDNDELIDEEDPGCWDIPGDSSSYNPKDNDEYNTFCGDGSCNGNETCSTCPQDCGSCGGGGGIITKPTIIITNEKVVYLGNGEALVTWTTNIETTRQVVYGDNSITTLGAVPEYGYDTVNGESTDMTKEHSVTIGGLADGVVYYFRPVADRNGSTGEVVGIEVSYEIGEVKGIETPTPSPAECNYLLEYIKLGADNNSVEVEKLERFLNEFEGENLLVNGIYEQIDFDAVSRFQEKYLTVILSPWSHNKATGYVYITTKKKINELYCQREFPLTAEQEAEVVLFSERILSISAAGSEDTEASDDSGENLVSEDTVESSETKGSEEDGFGRVGGVEDEADEDESDDEVAEEETETEDKTSETEGEVEITIQDVQEEDADESEYASDRYSKYLPAFLIVIIIVGGTWYFLSGRKEKEEVN